MKTGVTAHIMVRNEPLVYYAVKAVYDFMDVILLYDTGSYDPHTLEDIRQLLAEDSQKKIVFKQVPIETDETRWTNSNWRQEQRKNAGKRGKGQVRAEMMKDTKTPFFFIVDGDEVHYRESMRRLRAFLPAWPKGKNSGYVPSVWYCDPEHIFRVTPHWGRLYKRGDIEMMTASPGEMYTWKGQIIQFNTACAFQVPKLIPYAHFETMLRPWRRPVVKRMSPPRALPEVMIEQPKYLDRFLREGPFYGKP